MFVLAQFNINQRKRLWVLMDTHTCMPLLYPLQYLVDHLALRTAATQSASLQAIKFFYEFWYQKHGVTKNYQRQMVKNSAPAACQNQPENRGQSQV
ncbi:hypothetical protein [Pectobacterium carotovorum]|uniref:hypothetical protein n=1 Tax=Pectobacterium carotovorum TaxID=554 RepID=UPI001CF255FB|nr:hypothetical protein [Pectobacterium carotovorum]MCA6966451.1 hypothetical protein [Pectobacterium carotovorum]